VRADPVVTFGECRKLNGVVEREAEGAEDVDSAFGGECYLGGISPDALSGFFARSPGDRMPSSVGHLVVEPQATTEVARQRRSETGKLMTVDQVMAIEGRLARACQQHRGYGGSDYDHQDPLHAWASAIPRAVPLSSFKIRDSFVSIAARR